MSDDDQVRNDALRLLNAATLLPRLVVFDLDYTLWPFYCEFKSKSDSPRLFKEAKGILNALKEKEVKMAVASRTPTPDIAKVFLNKLSLNHFFVHTEIFPSWTHKTEHLQNIQKKTNIPFDSMLFFDDEDRNVETVSRMGVSSVLVDNGITVNALKEGLINHAKRAEKSAS